MYAASGAGLLTLSEGRHRAHHPPSPTPPPPRPYTHTQTHTLLFLLLLSHIPKNPPEDRCEPNKLPDGFWSAAPMHLVSVKTRRAPLPGLHQQPGDGADGNSVCVMLEAGRSPAPSDSQPKSLTCPV